MQQADARRRQSSLFRSGFAEQQSRLILRLWNVCSPFVYVQAALCRHHGPRCAPGDDPAPAAAAERALPATARQCGPRRLGRSKHRPYREKRRGDTERPASRGVSSISKRAHATAEISKPGMRLFYACAEGGGGESPCLECVVLKQGIKYLGKISSDSIQKLKVVIIR